MKCVSLEQKEGIVVVEGWNREWFHSFSIEKIDHHHRFIVNSPTTRTPLEVLCVTTKKDFFTTKNLISHHRRKNIGHAVIKVIKEALTTHDRSQTDHARKFLLPPSLHVSQNSKPENDQKNDKKEALTESTEKPIKRSKRWRKQKITKRKSGKNRKIDQKSGGNQ